MTIAIPEIQENGNRYQRDDGACRYELGVTGARSPLLWVGLNPSTGGVYGNDPTMREVEKLTTAAGSDGWILVNLYPRRSKRPKDLPRVLSDDLAQSNLSVIRNALSAVPASSRVVYAWGVDSALNALGRREVMKRSMVAVDEIVNRAGLPRMRMERSNASTDMLPTPWHPLHAAGCLTPFTDMEFRAYLDRRMGR